MSDILDKPVGVPVDFVDDAFKLEVIDEKIVPEKDEATLALEAKIEELEAGNSQYKEALEQLTSNQGQDANLSLLAQEVAKLKETQAPQAPAQTKQEVDYGKLIETTDKNFYQAPSKSVLDLVSPVVQSLDAKYGGMAEKQSLNISKLTVLADDAVKGDYIRYKDEVDKLVQLSPPSETIYMETLKKVRANHMDDIIAEQVALQVAKITDAAEAEAAKAVAPAPFTNATQQSAVPPKAAVPVRISTQDQAYAQRWALIKGYTWADLEDQKFVVNYLKKTGEIK